MGHAKRWIEAQLLPHGWTDILRQIGLFVGAFLLYDAVRGAVLDGNPYKPFGNAMRIINFERALHIFVEPSVQAWAENKHVLMDVLDWTYLNGHFFITLAALVFIYFRRNDSFYFVRNVLLISMLLALFGYWLYPTAPPRLMPEWGFTDSVSQFVTHSKGYWDNTAAGAFANAYAAVPSMHVCFSSIIGLTMFRLSTHRLTKVAWSLYPALVTFVVVATANHFLVDVFLGALTAAISFAVAQRLLARARPEVWAFGASRRVGRGGHFGQATA
jgi:PAP2 superfamily